MQQLLTESAVPRRGSARQQPARAAGAARARGSGGAPPVRRPGAARAATHGALSPVPSSCGARSPLGGGDAHGEADGHTPEGGAEGSGAGTPAAPKRASFTPEQLRKLQVQMHVHSQLLVQVRPPSL